ncbi:hypothetical protein LHJ74_06675 [Streptomyces sp. N2-109]|uniref:Beta-ketoacyl synthase-like N-terminal domain-containing protein n=1 Tax=Streptomyces gossypii TaxID=2883101 RepID=A0ABT2JP12_9ACTN|nr:beta-ketoacyl synthase N-terminal-like domain-containing protein [Streptomyces gossypii]MCT2589610.1 hypothetical protein [Streptomyces gossypii]
MSVRVSGIGVIAPGVREVADLGSVAPAPAVGEDWFDPVPYLGARGWKYLTPATRHLLAAANTAVGRRPGEPAPSWRRPERVGVTTGTHHGIGALHARLDRTFQEEGLSGLSPAELPGFSVNIPASQLAIALSCQAFSVTFTNPVVSGLEAVSHAVAAIRRGRADRVFAGATEDAAPNGSTLGGAAVLHLEASSEPGPEIIGGASRFLPVRAGGQPDPSALAAAVQRVAKLAGASENIRYAFCGPDSMAAADEAVRGELAGRLVEDGPAVGADAGFGAVSAMLQLAWILRDPGPGLVLAASEDGHLVAVATRGEAA